LIFPSVVYYRSQQNPRLRTEKIRVRVVGIVWVMGARMNCATDDVRKIHDGSRVTGIEDRSQSTSSRKRLDKHVVAKGQGMAKFRLSLKSVDLH
jgi:hypothetical protein